MCQFRVYKCNSIRGPHLGDWGDFHRYGQKHRWGSTDQIPALANARPGDIILAYQTDRNELVGLATVVGLRPYGKYQELILNPGRKIGAKVRPLKQADPRIAAIPAFRPGPIQTLYNISSADAKRLLRAAGVQPPYGATPVKRRKTPKRRSP